mmetsp:Transcript_20964/g.25957  ORF Transcript_20964/g.25957 Transcript_20964/m.25957 type:complete len:115 (-) Transcript_20964:415-759(-)
MTATIKQWSTTTSFMKKEMASRLNWLSLISGELSRDALIAIRDAAVLYLDERISSQYDNFEPSNNNFELEIKAHRSFLGSNSNVRHRRLQLQRRSYITFLVLSILITNQARDHP